MPKISDSFKITNFSSIPLPILTIKFHITNPNKERFERIEEFYVDTGFSGDLKLSKDMGLIFREIGIQSTEEMVRIPNGSVEIDSFKAIITEIVLNSFNIMSNSQPCVILCMGDINTPNLVGLHALRKWKVCMDLPHQILSIE